MNSFLRIIRLNSQNKGIEEDLQASERTDLKLKSDIQKEIEHKKELKNRFEELEPSKLEKEMKSLDQLIKSKDQILRNKIKSVLIFWFWCIEYITQML